MYGDWDEKVLWNLILVEKSVFLEEKALKLL